MKILSLSSRNMKEIYRDPVSVLLGLAIPIGLMFLFTSIHEKTKLDIFSAQLLAPGIIIFSAAFLMMFSGMLLAKDRQNTFLLRLFATPLTSSDFIFSYLLPFIPLALLQISLCMIVAYILGASFANLGLVLLILFLNSICCISLGMLFGSLFSVNQVSGFGSLVITAISIFSGAWTPLDIMGDVFKYIAYAMPFSHAIEATRGLILGTPFAEVAQHVYWVIIFTVLITLSGILAFRWRTRPV